MLHAMEFQSCSESRCSIGTGFDTVKEAQGRASVVDPDTERAGLRIMEPAGSATPVPPIAAEAGSEKKGEGSGS